MRNRLCIYPAAVWTTFCWFAWASRASCAPAELERHAEGIQRRVDFVFYIPDHLPPDARPEPPMVVPQRTLGRYRLPNQVYIRLGGKLAMWQMPVLESNLSQHAQVLSGPAGCYFWLLSPPKSRYVSIAWNLEGTRLGLTGAYSAKELMKVATSVRPAAPAMSPRPRYALAPGGIGVSLSCAGGVPVVIQVTPGMPAARAGVRPGDEVVRVQGRPVRRALLENVTRLIRGSVGTKVAVTFKRPTGEVVALALPREPVPTVVSVRRRLEDAVRAVPFRAVLASYLPKGTVVAETLITRVSPDRTRAGPQLDVVYRSGPSGIIWIRERKSYASEEAAPTVRQLRPGEHVLEKTLRGTTISVHTYSLSLTEAQRVFDSLR
jgi:hypothetical protein